VQLDVDLAARLDAHAFRAQPPLLVAPAADGAVARDHAPPRHVVGRALHRAAGVARGERAAREGRDVAVAEHVPARDAPDDVAHARGEVVGHEAVERGRRV